MTSRPVVVGVSEAVALINQTLEYAYPELVVVGELSSFQVSKGKWVYADIKDEQAKLRLFGTVYMLHTPLEDGMMVEVVARPLLHPLYGFSLQLRSIKPVGEGSIKKSALILEKRLEAEGLFAPDRKRIVPYPPTTVGLIASGDSAAYADFVKIMKARWEGVDVYHYEVHVQGDAAVTEVVEAIQYFNQQADPVEVIVIIRGGGSSDDLAAFSTETVTRAVAASRISTVVAVGHEIDISLAERAADLAASTPSNAAELLFPDAKEVRKQLYAYDKELGAVLSNRLMHIEQKLSEYAHTLESSVERYIATKENTLLHLQSMLTLAHPRAAMARGYAIVTGSEGRLIKSKTQVYAKDDITITLNDGTVDAQVKKVY